MYNMVTIVNNTVLYTWNFLTVDHMFSPHLKKKKKETITMWSDVCIR